ncbi:MAG: GNAT family N-acetyltransferase [Actinobacteria bacterium]|nr:GNAT family N-acetyltransferase [Actinomycetota bacterium]
MRRSRLRITEVGTAETHRGRGLGKAMMAAMLDVARHLGCAEAWVLTERDNTAALNAIQPAVAKSAAARAASWSRF